MKKSAVLHGLMCVHEPLRATLGDNTCMQSTRLAVDAFGRNGIATLPMAVELEIDGEVCTGSDATTFAGNVDYHVIAIVEGRWLLDLTLSQYGLDHRPQRLFPVPEDLAGGGTLTVSVDGHEVTYTARPEDQRFRSADAWHDDNLHEKMMEIIMFNIGR
jgi:hypothetical protein